MGSGSSTVYPLSGLCFGSGSMNCGPYRISCPLSCSEHSCASAISDQGGAGCLHSASIYVHTGRTSLKGNHSDAGVLEQIQAHISQRVSESTPEGNMRGNEANETLTSHGHLFRKK